MSTILKAYGVVLALLSCRPCEPIMIRTVPVTAGLISFTLLFAGCGGGGSGGFAYPGPDGGTAGDGGDGVVIVRTPAFSYANASGIWSMKSQYDAEKAGQWPS